MRKKQTQLCLDNGIKVKNRTFIQWLVIVVAFWSFLMKPVSSLPGGLGYLKHLPDGILLALLLLSFRHKSLTFRREILPTLLIVLGFFVYCLVVYLFQYQSVFYFLWGFRNNFRGYLAFFAFIAYLDERDVTMWFKAVDVLFWVNALISCFQFFVWGLGGDFLGGIFGISGSSNGFTLALLSIVAGKSLLEAFDGNERFWKSMFKCVVSIAVAAMAELKFYFVVFALLMVGATILTRFSVKKMIFLLIGAVTLMVGSALLVEWFGFQGFLSWEELWNSATKESYAGEDDINRLSSISTLCERILTTPVQQIFGLGMGNCDTSAFAICNTPFYRTYRYLHYTWFNAAMMFLETGYIGLTMYLGFFVVNFLQAAKRFKTMNKGVLSNRLAIMISLLCLILTFYNASVRAESGYMLYFVMAAPFIYSGAEKLKQQEGEMQ